MVMMTGELEYNDLYYPQRDHIELNITDGGQGQSFARGVIEDDDKPQYFPFTAHAVLTAFIVIVSIVIMNLLFGMAVSDVQVMPPFLLVLLSPCPRLVISVVKAAFMGS